MIVPAPEISRKHHSRHHPYTTDRRKMSSLNILKPGFSELAPKAVDASCASDSDTAQTTMCTKIPSFLNRFKSKDGSKEITTNQNRGKRVLRVFIRFRHWRRKKRRVMPTEKYRSEQDRTELGNSILKTEWESTSRHYEKKRFTRKRKYGIGVVLEDEIQDLNDCPPMRSRIKTSFAKIMRRRRRRSTAAKSFYSMPCSHSRRSIDIKKQNFAVGVIMRPIATLKARKYKGRTESDFTDRLSAHGNRLSSETPLKHSKKFTKARKKWLKGSRGSKQVTPAMEKCRRWLDDYSRPGGSRQVDDLSSNRFNLSEPFVCPGVRTNLKQKFFRVLKKFKKAGVIENTSIVKKLSSGDTGALDMIEDLMDKLSLGKSSQYFEDLVEGLSLNEDNEDSEVSLSIITQAKPTLKPYFTENKILWPSRISTVTRNVYCERCGPSTIRLRRSTTVHQSDLN